MRIRTAAVICLVCAVAAWSGTGDAQVKNDVRQFMRKKLDHSQKLLEAVAIEDFDAMARESQSLSLLSQEASWKVLQTEDYVQHSKEFRRTADAITQAARKKNLDGAALAYVDLTMKCVNCHKYVRGVRIADKSKRLPEPSHKERSVNHLPVQKVVVPVDFSDASLRAVDVALQFATGPEGVYVIYVLPIITDYEAAIVWENVATDARQHQGEQALREKLPGPKYEKLHMIVRVGDAGHEVANYAQDIAADLIVLPSHGRRGLSHLLIGSVAERIVRLAHCPVLVLKQPRTAT